MKLTYEEALDAIANDRQVTKSDVLAKDLKRKVWIAENGMPGCLPDSISYCRTKEGAIDTCLQIADDGEGEPRGMVTALRKWEAYETGLYRYSVSQATLADIL